MTGEALHQRYVNAMADEGIIIDDTWDELNEDEKNAWTALTTLTIWFDLTSEGRRLEGERPDV